MFENRTAIQRQSKKFKRFQNTQPFEMLYNANNNKTKLKCVNKCNSSNVNSINYNRTTSTVVSSFNSSASDMSACRSPSSSSSSSTSSSSCFTTGSSSSLLCSRRPFAATSTRPKPVGALSLASPTSSLLSSLSSPSSSSSSTSSSSSLLADESIAPAVDEYETSGGDISRGSSNYFADDQVFYNLILKERAEMERRDVQQQQNQNHLNHRPQQQQLTGQLRHMLLSWMLKVCEHQMCQDEIFPLATIILEKFLALNPIVGALSRANQSQRADLFVSESEENNSNNRINNNNNNSINNNDNSFQFRTNKRRHQLLDVASYHNHNHHQYHYFCYEDASGNEREPKGGSNRVAAAVDRATNNKTSSAACVFDLDSNLNSVDLNKLHPISQHQHDDDEADVNGDKGGAVYYSQDHNYDYEHEFGISNGGGGGGGDHDNNGRRQEGGRALLFECNEHNVKELEQRQLCLFAVCSLLLATKMRQTARLCVQTLIEFSRLELPLELTRDEILDGELLMLSVLKWDLAALVAPNDFLIILTRKCQKVLSAFLGQAGVQQRRQGAQNKLISNHNHNNNDNNNRQHTISGKKIDEQYGRDLEQLECQHQHQQRHHHHQQHHQNNDNNNNHRQQQQQLINRSAESRVRQHTQTLLELCLMGK